ncbi:Protein lingerer [Orchesella cincta]|uniref:Protein lingerer n=1 Tax=Orchesella cincta TaxID=48709 RepID=A0A1D2N5V9_ORCCI|nr:Protein lingerer [Orchesella cincta]
MSSGATKGPSTKGGASSNKGGTSNSKMNNNSSTKGGKSSNKSDSSSKPEKTDLNPKIQPTAEQIQIAKIMDTHRAEDPDLQRKIRQVMEIARTTEDQASMALHSREYDIEQAITLLTEGGGQSLEAEWAQAGKKRKQKSAQKADNAAAKEKGIGKDSERAGGDRVEKRDRDKPDRKDGESGDGQTDSRRGDRGGRGGLRRGGRGGGRGGRTDSGKENEESIGSRGGFGRSTNGLGRGGRGGPGRGRGGTGGGGRMFSSRTRGRDDYNTIDVWENSQAEATPDAAPLKVDNWDEFPPTEDWDNEEYTGSLADTKVFTPSSQTAPGGAAPLTDATNVGGSGPPPSANHLPNSAGGGANASELQHKMSQGGGQPDSVTPGTGVVTMSSVVAGLNSVGNSGGGGSAVVPGQSIDINMLLQKPSANSNTSTGVSSNPGADLLASLQSSYTNSSQVGGLPNSALPQRQKVQRPRGPPSKIPASAVEMPDNAVTTLDVQFGGLDFGSDSSVTFNSVMHGKGESLLYGSPASKIDTFSAPVDKDTVQLKGSSVTDSSPFQNQRTSQGQPPSLNESNKANMPSNSSPNLDSHSMSSLNQSQPKNQSSGPSSYGAAVNSGSATGSAFVSYGKGAPGFAAPGFQATAPVVGGAYNSSAAAVAVQPSSYGAQQPTMPTQVGQPGYHGMNSMTYGAQPTVPSGVQSNQAQGQPQTLAAAVSQTQVQQAANPAFGNSAAQPQSSYHHSANSTTNSTGYATNSSGSSQYGSYGSKMPNTLSGSSSVKDANDSSLNVSASTTGAAISTAQLTSGVQPGSVIPASTATSSTKMATVSNSMTNNTATSKMGGIPPGMMMQPQGYILGQAGTVPAFYSVQAPMYGFEDNSVQFVPRIPHHIPGYYDASGAGFGTGVPGAPGVSGRNDGAAIQAYSTGADGRFQRSDSSTASPVPSNLAGGNTQQAMYNPPVPGYYFLGNNAMVHGTPYPFAAAPPHHMYQTAPMAAATNASGAPHAPASNHQYQNKSVYSGASYTTYDGSQSGPNSDFGKNSYSGGSGVGPNSNSAKGGSGTTPGVSQSTDINSSIYAKGHMNKMNSYDKQGYGTSTGGGYTSMGAAQGIGNQLGAGGMPPYGIYVTQQPDSGNVSRQGTGQPKGGKQQYNAPYWGN